jgi:4-diphosphocytidyl-2-C-methyl-D-erythritol kinase
VESEPVATFFKRLCFCKIFLEGKNNRQVVSVQQRFFRPVILKGDARLLLEVIARAKINLTLDVLSLRPDGYHEVKMIMQTIELHDRLFLEPAQEAISLACDHPGVPSGEENLIYRAAVLLKEYTGQKKGVTVILDKNIPVAAGLAGGSTDAAAALKGLNSLWELGLTASELMLLGERLGADVPFCLVGGTALARGKGEVLFSLPPLPRMGVVLVKPPFGVSTVQVYRQYDLTGGGPRPDTKAMLVAIEGKDVKRICHLLANVLETTAALLHPEIITIKNFLLEAGATGAAMSGSGPNVFGLCESEEKAVAVASKLKLPSGWVKLVTAVGSG